MDTAFFEDTQQMGFGLVLRNEKGEFIAAQSKTIDGCYEVDVGEAMGFLEALTWLKRLDIIKVVIEGDAKGVVDAIKSASIYNS